VSKRTLLATLVAIAAGLAAATARGVPAKMAVETGDIAPFFMSALFASVLLWIPARLIVGLAIKLIEKNNG
jgi:hypothetical protein